MKSGVVAIAVVLAVVLVVGGYFLFSGNYGQTNTQSNNLGVSDNTPATGGNSQDTETTNLQGGSQSPQTYDIEISGFSFQPQELRIKQNDVVVWTNQDSAMHTVTSDLGNELNSNSLSTGQSYSHTFNEKGKFDYHCTPHPYMKGKIVVE